MSPASVRITTRTGSAFFAGSSAVAAAKASTVPTTASTFRRMAPSGPRTRSHVDHAGVEPAEVTEVPEPRVGEAGVVESRIVEAGVIVAGVVEPRVVVAGVVVARVVVSAVAPVVAAVQPRPEEPERVEAVAEEGVVPERVARVDHVG